MRIECECVNYPLFSWIYVFVIFGGHSVSASVHTHAHGRIPFHSDLGVCARACVKWGRQQLATEPAERTHILYVPYTNTQIVSILCVAQPKHTHICTCGNVWVGRGARCVTDSVFACVFTRMCIYFCICVVVIVFVLKFKNIPRAPVCFFYNASLHTHSCTHHCTATNEN